MEWIGLLYVLLVFLFCFAIICFFRLAALGFKFARGKSEKPMPEKKSEEKPEPVYYIVEKKRARKASYAPPKEIKFKDSK